MRLKDFAFGILDRRTQRTLFAAIMVIGAVLSETPAVAQGAAASADGAQVQYRLGSGDRLRVLVFGHADLSGEFEIDGSGRVSLPLVGNVSLGGKTLGQAETAIVNTLKPDYLKNPRVSLQVLNYRPFFIIGEVKSPGKYSYVNGLTVLEAVAIAGGFTYRARESSMRIIRGTDPKREKRDASPKTVILPGDVIEVPERFF